MTTTSESKRRSLVKAMSWRIIAILILGTISYIFTGNWEDTSLITIAYSLVQVFIYFLHERLWERIRWGKPNSIDSLPPARELTPEENAIVLNRLKELGYIE